MQSDCVVEIVRLAGAVLHQSPSCNTERPNWHHAYGSRDDVIKRGHEVLGTRGTYCCRVVLRGVTMWIRYFRTLCYDFVRTRETARARLYKSHTLREPDFAEYLHEYEVCCYPHVRDCVCAHARPELDSVALGS